MEPSKVELTLEFDAVSLKKVVGVRSMRSVLAMLYVL